MNGILAYLLGVVVFLVGIGFSIGLHEVGHLLPAKLFGARVSRYMIGFGPTIWSRQVGETTYGVKLLPLGGYIAISGMFPPAKAGRKKTSVSWLRDWVESARKQQAEADGNYDEAKAFYRLSIPKRIVVMLGGPFMNLVLGTILVFVALCGIGGYQTGTQVSAILPCVPASYTQTTCAPSDIASPAVAAGLQVGDTVVALNGQAISTWSPVQQLLISGPSVIQLTVKRAGQTRVLTVHPVVVDRPVVDPVSESAQTNPDGSYKLAKRGVIGIGLKPVRAPYSVSDAGKYVGQMVSQTALMIVDLPRQIEQLAVTTFTGGKRTATGPVSVVGIGNIAGSIGTNNALDIPSKIATWLMILGSLNFALFAFNLVPLLPLDGGHVLNGLVEAVKRGAYRLVGKPDPGPMDTAIMVPFTMVMWFVLMAVSALVILSDIIHPISLG